MLYIKQTVNKTLRTFQIKTVIKYPPGLVHCSPPMDVFAPLNE
jgi:hypothetical protein